MARLQGATGAQVQRAGRRLAQRRSARLASVCLLAVLGALLVATCMAGQPAPPAGPSSGCRLLSAPGAVPAFCETFDEPAGIGNRSGDLNGTLWGVSRQLGAVNSGQNQYYDVSPTIMDKCGPNLTVQPPSDVAICNGQLVDAQTDQHGVTSLAMYPKQPFDIAGRTGTIAFDVSDDSHGNHRAWPELWYTDQPVPAPFDHFSSLQSVPRNGFGVRFAGFCPANVPGCGVRFACPDEPPDVPVITVDSAVVVNNYNSDDSFMDVGTGTISVKAIDCVKASSGPGDMNHFELRVSPNEIDVYGIDAGAAGPLKKIAIISNMALTLTRGLVWLEDVHYNGDKDGPDQGTHTFTWDNLAFDGPVLPRDLAFDVLDNTIPVGPAYPGLVNLGWPLNPTDPAPLTLSVPGVYNLQQAAGAILTFNYNTQNPVTISYRINDGAWQEQPWPFGTCYAQNGITSCGSKTLAVPVSLSDVVPGSNAVQFKSSDYAAVANVDLVLLGAFGLGNLGFFGVSPCRVADTRLNAGASMASAIPGSGGKRTFSLASAGCSIPANASAVSINLTVVNPGATGYLTAYSAALRTTPLTSSINFIAGETRANNAVVQVSTDGSASITVENTAPVAVDLLIDVNGYFQ
jgi:hypothetical protein